MSMRHVPVGGIRTLLYALSHLSVGIAERDGLEQQAVDCLHCEYLVVAWLIHNTFTHTYVL